MFRALVALTSLACASGAHAGPSCDALANKQAGLKLAQTAADAAMVEAFRRQIAEVTPLCNAEKAASATPAAALPTGSEPQFGMTFQQAEATKWGKPTAVNDRVQWVFMDSVTHQTRYLYFTNGRLSGIEQ